MNFQIYGYTESPHNFKKQRLASARLACPIVTLVATFLAYNIGTHRECGS